MPVAPICPKCGSNGHQGGQFHAREWAENDAKAAGLDPLRTSAAAFECLACGHVFPAITWTRETVNSPSIGLFREDGTPHTF